MSAPMYVQYAAVVRGARKPVSDGVTKGPLTLASCVLKATTAGSGGSSKRCAQVLDHAEAVRVRQVTRFADRPCWKICKGACESLWICGTIVGNSAISPGGLDTTWPVELFKLPKTVRQRAVVEINNVGAEEAGRPHQSKGRARVPLPDRRITQAAANATIGGTRPHGVRRSANAARTSACATGAWRSGTCEALSRSSGEWASGFAR